MVVVNGKDKDDDDYGDDVDDEANGVVDDNDDDDDDTDDADDDDDHDDDDYNGDENDDDVDSNDNDDDKNDDYDDDNTSLMLKRKASSCVYCPRTSSQSSLSAGYQPFLNPGCHLLPLCNPGIALEMRHSDKFGIALEMKKDRLTTLAFLWKWTETGILTTLVLL